MGAMSLAKPSFCNLTLRPGYTNKLFPPPPTTISPFPLANSNHQLQPSVSRSFTPYSSATQSLLTLFISTILIDKLRSIFHPAKMRFIATLATGAACLATAVAQVNIAFASVPVAVVVGQPTNITWAGGDGVTVSEALLGDGEVRPDI